MSLLKTFICRLIGHRSVLTITNASLRDASIFGLGFVVNGHRWDCTRCGSTGVKDKGIREWWWRNVGLRWWKWRTYRKHRGGRGNVNTEAPS